VSLPSGAIETDAADVNDIDIDGLHTERGPVTGKGTAVPVTDENAAVADENAAVEVIDERVDDASTTVEPDATPTATPKWRAWMRPWMEPWFASLKVAAGVWLAAGIAYTFVTVYASRLLPDRPAPGISDLMGLWYKYDTVFYVRIAEGGYGWYRFAPAFYPLYPGLIKIVNPVLPGGGLPAAMFLSVLFALAALVLMHRLVDEEFGAKVASRTVFYFAAFPAGFFLFAAYNESLYISLVIAALYAARKGHFWIASVAAALAGSTRLFGLLLAAPLAYEYMRQRGWSLRKIRWDALSFLVIPTGVIAFAIYLQIKVGDWLAFSHAQEGWHRKYGWPGAPIWKTIKLLNDKPYLLDWRLLAWFNLISVVGAIMLLVLVLRSRSRLAFRKDQYYLLVYAAAPILLFSSTEAGYPHYLMSAPRIALEWFPAFIVLGMLGASRTFERSYLFLALMGQTLFLAPMLLQIQFTA
jgi:Gpi18-like mannosyltransferase